MTHTGESICYASCFVHMENAGMNGHMCMVQCKREFANEDAGSACYSYCEEATSIIQAMGGQPKTCLLQSFGTFDTCAGELTVGTDAEKHAQCYATCYEFIEGLGEDGESNCTSWCYDDNAYMETAQDCTAACVAGSVLLENANWDGSPPQCPSSGDCRGRAC